MTTTTSERAATGLGNFLDERVGASKAAKGFARKIFPDHWSFLLGEIALFSFVILLLTGVFLTFFFIPSAAPVKYDGSYLPAVGQTVSQAYESTVRMSFDIRGGLLMRQIHHWAALIFVASITVHMFRVFFTGAFRKPRELNWVIGSTLALLAIVEGFAGYSLPDDLLSGTGLRIASSIILAIPIVGSYLSFFIFGGQFPGEAFIPRLYTIHVLVLPALFLVLITAHLFMVVLHKHTQYPGPGRTNDNVVGYPLLPVYMAKAGGFFFIVFGITALVSALFTINPIWNFGPYDPSPVTAGSQPDWYMGWMDGAVRLTPGFLEVSFWGHTLSGNILFPALIIPGLVTIPMILYPWIEAMATGDRREHHILDRPRNAPVRTGLGMMAITFYVLLWISGGNDILAVLLKLSINDITRTLRLLTIVLPPLVFVLTKRICLGMQRRDRAKVLHGVETSRVFRTEEGEVWELHQPLDRYERWTLVAFEPAGPLALPAPTDKNGVRRPGAKKDKRRTRLSRFYFQDTIQPVTPTELEEAHGHGAQHAVGAEEHAAVTTGGGH